MKKIIRNCVEHHYKKKGFHKGYGSLWVLAALAEFKASNIPVRKRMWALKRGFYPYRIAQYNLSNDNYRDMLSDRDYKLLYPINNQYRIWIDDKLTMKYILKPFDEYMPKYYFHLMNGRNLMKLMDCPIDGEVNYQSILTLLKEKEKLALKPAAGTYGIGFCLLAYSDGEFYINNEIKTEEEMVTFFAKVQDHIITEYVKMHDVISKLNSGSLNTVRVMLINEHGDDPVIASSFMRIGTKQSGIVDNTAQGGMFCKVDIETGRFYDGEKINNHIISPSPIHPDTGEKVEGIIPNWGIVKEKLIEIAKYMPQLEWMGFDIAITEMGFNIIEINSHQGLHRYHTYPHQIKDYFMRKLNVKRKRK